MTTEQILLSIHDVKAKVAMGRTKIYSLIKQKRFPPPIHHSALGQLVRWRATDIADFIDAVASGREWSDNDVSKAA